MAQIIDLPTGDIWDNNFPIEDQSAGAQTWYADNITVFLQTYIFLDGFWTTNMVSLPSGYSGNWDNKKSKTTQTGDGELWYDDAVPVLKRIVPFSNSTDLVELIRGNGDYNRNLPLSGQTVPVINFISQIADTLNVLSIFNNEFTDEININGEIWDNNLPYSAQTAGAQTEADSLWGAGIASGNKAPIDGVGFVNEKISGAFKITIPVLGSQDYNFKNI